MGRVGHSEGRRPLRLGLMISGSGRTLQNLHDRIAAGALPAEIGCVISSRADVYGVQRAHRLNLPVRIVDRNTILDPEFHVEITRHLRDADVDLVCMAGFNCLWRIPPAFAGRVINIHPALLPKFGGRGFYGARVHEAVIAADETKSGCTVHFCDNEYDHGPVILQRQVAVLPDDTPATLAARVFEQECIAYPDAVALIAAGRVRLEDGVVHVDAT